jgi:hypothetical protein
MRQKGKFLQLHGLTRTLGVDKAQAHEYLIPMGYEGPIAISSAAPPPAGESPSAAATGRWLSGRASLGPRVSPQEEQ